MPQNKFIPGQTYIPVSGKIFDKTEINNAIAAAKDGWWTEGRFSKQFELDFKAFFNNKIKFISLVNSGSSANLLAIAALTAKIFGSRSLKPGDEVITTAVAFPTTINPLILYGLVPVFIDAEIDSFNIKASDIESAITKKTKAIMIAHTLGKPFNVDKILKIAKKYNLWLIEDCCDALGSKYNDRLLGTFADLATFSFYPAHQITMGEGGAIITNNSRLHKTIRQFRDWGRDCWCGTGQDNSCKKRFKWQLGELPFAYDHKYIYSQIGFNLKLTDFQSAIGVAQLKKLPKFIKQRKKNYGSLFKFFSQYPQYFKLMKTAAKEDPAWFGFPLLVKKKAPFSRNQLTEYLEINKIGTRNVFAGNLLRHPAYINLKDKIKIHKQMINADKIMNQAFWLGVFPGIDKVRLDYIKKTIQRFLKKL
ncbi:MAG: lipopolysaccharide biosynthesis protein RfbH [Candidatus Woesebacteria bacterium]|jgi:CDP-6-deoxy-D-xylo-4-hexulose-3-dehydrase